MRDREVEMTRAGSMMVMALLHAGCVQAAYDEARALPTGKHAAVMPLTASPRAPLGPSVTLRRGIPSRSTARVCQASSPAVRVHCSTRVS